MKLGVSEIFQECESIFLERAKEYGHFVPSYTKAERIADWLVPDEWHLPAEEETSFPGEKMLIAMIAVKLSRGIRNEDTILDLINYLAMYLAAWRNWNADIVPEHPAQEAGA